MPSVGAADGTAHAEAALGEVEAVSDRAADTVERSPFQMRSLDATLVDQVLDETPDRVVGERRDERRAHPEATLQPARDVVLASAFPGPERPRGRYPAVTWVEPQHDLAERDEVPSAVLLGAEGEPVHVEAASRASAARSVIRS